MPKKYIYVKNSMRQFEADNWLLMIPSDKLSSDSKLVYLILKRIQGHDMSCMTDAHSWYKISGLKMDRVKECLNELESYGLIEQYWSTKNSNPARRLTTFTVYLLEHFLMKGCYEIRDCPHDNDSFPNPQDTEHILRNSLVAQTIKQFKEQG
jgi:hypothetical protein